MFLINGETSDCLTVTDRALHYGDGVFETMAVYRGKILCLDQHYQRLVDGCRRLNIIPPDSDLLFREANSLPGHDQTGVLKIIVTRGTGGRGYRAPEPAPSPTRIIGLYPWPDYPQDHVTEGVAVRYCDTRLARNPTLAGIKHLNRLEQVVARSEWRDDSIAEGLMLDTADNVISGTMSNLFLVKNDRLLTPLLEHSGIKGIVRQAVMDRAAKFSLKPVVTTIDKNDLRTADALFVTNSILGVWPVRQLDNQQYDDLTVAKKVRQLLADDGLIIP